jgi:hypothetical protein
MRHPWALNALQNAAAGPNAMRHFEQSLAAISDTGLAEADKFALLALVDDYVHGNVLCTAEIRSAAVVDDDAVEAGIQYGQEQLATGEFPHTQAMFGGKDPRDFFARLLSERSERERFERGLVVLLDGVASRMKLSLPDRPAIP